MNIKLLAFISISFLSLLPCNAQNDLNITDSKGLKQGHWIKKYPHGTVMYDGIFKDDHPAGEFRRFYENGVLKSVLVYSEDGTEADATIFHPSGFPASKGKYIAQLREGKWQFFSADSSGCLIGEENYKHNMKNGPSLKYYPNGRIAERVNYLNNLKNGEWLQCYQNGKPWIRSTYVNGKLNGKFEVWFETGIHEFSGVYKNNSRDGIWMIYNPDGTLRYKAEYKDGFTTDRQIETDQARFIDYLERNKDNVDDPGKTGTMW
jgi:antitoxin component YwqK of YwqJK toxin-antitoxin module